MFTSIEKSWNSGIKATGDYKELCPEFYCDASFLLNLREMVAIGDQTLEDVENAQHFVETMRDALESDVVSQNLHLWIDLIFGYKQREDGAMGLFPETCYGVNWTGLKIGLEKEAFEVICREFGQSPDQLFFVPHPGRVFRKVPSVQIGPKIADQGLLLEAYLNNLQEKHQQKINDMLEQYYKSKKKLEASHKEELEYITLKINGLRNKIQEAVEDRGEGRPKGGDERPMILSSQHSQKLIKSKSPNIMLKQSEGKGSLEQDTSKSRIENSKKTRTLQSKTPTKLF
jgi:hypothetical protein